MTLIDWKEFYYYDETSPSCLRRNADWRCGPQHRTVKGARHDALTDKSSTGYWRTFHKTRAYKIHRIIWELFHGPIEEGYVVDHIDGNTLNNKINNLRLVTMAVNQRNCKKAKNSGEVTGVSKVVINRKTGVIDTYWRAAWVPLGKKTSTFKFFPVKKFGEEQAFRMACEYRANMIAELNAQGAGYSETHGERP